MKGEYSAMPDAAVAHYHLPGLFESYDFYRAFLPLYRRHREYFYDWCDIASLYGAPEGCLWVYGQAKEDDSGQTYRIDCVSADGVRQKETTLTLPAASIPGQSRARDLGAVFYLPGEEAPCAILQEQPLAEESGLRTDGGVLTLCRPQQDGALVRQAQLPLPQALQADAGLTLASGSDGVAAGMARHLNAVYDPNHVHWADSARGGSLFQSADRESFFVGFGITAADKDDTAG